MPNKKMSKEQFIFWSLNKKKCWKSFSAFEGINTRILLPSPLQKNSLVKLLYHANSGLFFYSFCRGGLYKSYVDSPNFSKNNIQPCKSLLKNKFVNPHNAGGEF